LFIDFSRQRTAPFNVWC